MSAFERSFGARLGRWTLWLVGLAVPVLAVVAWRNGTGAPWAVTLGALAPLGLWLARARLSTRAQGHATALALTSLAALLVHFGRGPWTTELHFVFFVALAGLTLYANPMVCLAAGVAVVLQHGVLWALTPAAPLAAVLLHGVFLFAASLVGAFVARAFFDSVVGLEQLAERRTERLEAVLDRLSAQQLLLAKTSAIARLGGFEWCDRDAQPELSLEAREALGIGGGEKVTARSLLSMLTLPSRRALVAAMREAFTHDTPFTLELELRSTTGGRWARVMAQVEHGASQRRVFGAVQDFTEQVQARAAALAASEAKSQFLANMSHEVRTPLNGILGMAQLALDDAEDLQQREYLQLIQLSGQNLLAIVNDVLDLARIESGQLSLDRAPVDVRALLGDLVRPAAWRAQLKGLELLCSIEPQVPAVVAGDALRVTQVLNNLLGNAVKFTLTGTVGVRVFVEGGFLRFEVRDSGIGIPADKQAAIFERFVQADGATTRRFGGTGLGLSISSELATRMGGDLTVRSELGVGSAFTFSLPCEALEPPPVLKLARPMRVLLVEPPGELRALLEAQLQDLGATVTSAEPQALPADAGARFDLVVCTAERFGSPVSALGLRTVVAARRGLPQPRGVVVVQRPALHHELLRVLDGLALEVPRPSRPSMTGATSRALDVLLAEDNPVNARLVTVLLTRLGHRVVHAPDGAAAVTQCQTRTFDLVLMDMQMPQLDGLDATRAIRALERDSGNRVAIVALTANAMTGDRERCLEAGMDGYLSKPLKVDELEAVLAARSQARVAA